MTFELAWKVRWATTRLVNLAEVHIGHFQRLALEEAALPEPGCPGAARPS